MLFYKYCLEKERKKIIKKLINRYIDRLVG